MKRKFLFIAMLAITLFAVQGYAQGARGRENHGQNNKSHSERSYSRKTTPKQAYRPQDKPKPKQVSHPQDKPKPKQNYSSGSRPKQGPSKQNIKETPRHNSHHYVAPPMRKIKRPVYRHHQEYRHHRHICVFDGWTWFVWRGYTNRFIRHDTHHDRYFDSMLGYYLWGSFNAPTRIGIGAINFSRYRGYLSVSIGAKTSYIDLYFERRITFQEGHTFIEIITGKGDAIIHFYDDYGNSAIYRM